MREAQRNWADARDRLAAAVRSAGFPGELADLLAKELGSPKAIDRMTSWLYHVRPRSLETVADEMLAIRADLDAWIEKKESQAAQAGINDWLNSRERREQEEPEEDGRIERPDAKETKS